MIRSRLKAEPLTAIHAYSQHAVLLSADDLQRVPSVVSTDGSAIQNAEQLPYRRPTRFTRRTASVTERMERRVLEAATIVVAQSEWAAKSLRDSYGFDADRLRVIPFGIIPSTPVPPASADHGSAADHDRRQRADAEGGTRGCSACSGTV